MSLSPIPSFPSMLHNALTYKNMTLFCIVEGEYMSHAFKLKYISSSDDINDLKQRIKAENSNTFIGIDAKDLALWRVSIPKVTLRGYKSYSEGRVREGCG
jgi:hypothetical protein